MLSTFILQLSSQIFYTLQLRCTQCCTATSPHTSRTRNPSRWRSTLASAAVFCLSGMCMFQSQFVCSLSILVKEWDFVMHKREWNINEKGQNVTVLYHTMCSPACLFLLSIFSPYASFLRNSARNLIPFSHRLVSCNAHSTFGPPHAKQSDVSVWILSFAGFSEVPSTTSQLAIHDSRTTVKPMSRKFLNFTAQLLIYCSKSHVRHSKYSQST